jgi:single-strand DNA-binding protein
MANDLNLCQFIGRLGKDPETRFTPGGESVTSFSLAVGSTWKDKSGAKQEATEWVNVTAFGKLSEIISQYCTKGTQMYLSGRMKTEKYTDKNGVEKYSTKIIASNMQLLGSKNADSAQSDNKRANSTRAAMNAQAPDGFDDDDVPF